MPQVICPYCNEPAVLTDSAVVYGKSYGMIYLCAKDKAWVGCHKGTDTPLGREADAELRDAKKLAHGFFDPFWQELMVREQVWKSTARSAMYRKLARTMGLPVEQCHIGMFDLSQCKRVVEICTEWRKRMMQR